MKNEAIDALELLKMQHEEVESLIEDIEDSVVPAEKLALFTELADKLAAHATIEEKIFYPAMMHERTRELLVESTEEHLSVKRLLADMLQLEVMDERFDAKLSVLKEQLEHHAREEEEQELFPKVRKLVSSDDLVAIGNEMLAMYVMLLDREPRKQVPLEIAFAAPLEARL